MSTVQKDATSDSGKPERTSQEAVSPPEDKPKVNSRSGRQRYQKKVPKSDISTPKPQMRYLPKLMLEENPDEKTVLVKIGTRTSTRQVINYGLTKIKDDWKVTFNAFRMEMTKALQATEIIKTRVPFLHQENRLISYTTAIPTKPKEETTEDNADAEEEIKEGKEIERISSGISITLSRIQFEVQDLAGYQRPKPRQFMQPIPKSRPHPDERAHSEDAPKDLRKKKSRGGNNKKKNVRESHEASDGEEVEKVWATKKSTEETPREPPKPRNEKKGKKENFSKVKDPRDSVSEERKEVDHYYSREKRDRPYPPYYEEEPRFPPPMRRGEQRRRRGGPPAEHDRPRQHPSEFEDPRFRGPGRYEGTRDFPGSFRRPPPYGRGASHYGPPPYARGGHFGNRDNRDNRDRDERGDFEVPERPGYYAGNRQFRMDKIRDQPLEKGHMHDNFDREKQLKTRERDMKMRDQRNRPSYPNDRDNVKR